MKKLLALSLVLSMLALMSVAGFAADDVPMESGTNEQISVSANYEPVSDTNMILADVGWDEMRFVYTDGTQGQWDPDSHRYINGTAGGWPGATATISVTNHSNKPITATLSFAAEVSGIVGTFAEASGTANDKVLELATAEGTEVANAPTASAEFGISGAAIDESKSLGIITVTLAGADKPPEEVPGGDAAADVTSFTALQSAVDAGGTVRLGGDINTGDDILAVCTDDPVVIDLNGYTLSSDLYTPILVYSSSACTLRNGTVASNAANMTALQNQGTLTIQNCTIIANNHYPLFNYASATVTDSTLTGACSGTSIYNQSFSGSVTLTLGGSVMMTGNIAVEAEDYTITALAGTYSFDPSAYVDTDTYTVTDNGDGTWTVA